MENMIVVKVDCKDTCFMCDYMGKTIEKTCNACGNKLVHCKKKDVITCPDCAD